MTGAEIVTRRLAPEHANASRALIQAGMPPAKIARLLRCSVEGVERMRRSLDRYDQAVWRYQQGAPVAMCGLPASMLYDELHRRGIVPRRARRWWPEAAALAAQGLRACEIAKRLGRQAPAVRYALKQMQPKPQESQP